MPHLRTLLALALAGQLASNPGSAPAASTGGEDRLPDRAYVHRAQNHVAASLATAAKDAGLRIEAAASRQLIQSLQAVAARRSRGKDAASALQRLSQWTRVEAPGRDAVAELATVFPLSELEPAYRHRIAALPNDPLLPNQPYVELLGLEAAFDLVRGDQAPIVVGIVDGGTDWRHVDLRANVLERATEIEGNGVDDDHNGFVDDIRGWNFANDSNDPSGLAVTPLNAQHGTHIAGIVAAVSDNGVGISGVSWNARILPVNVGTDDADDDRAIVYGYEGLLYAAAAGADILNVSWGRSSGRWSDYENDVLLALEAIGVLVVAAAGNQIAAAPFYPAYYPSVLSVTRVGLDLVHHFSANHDTWIDLAAPGSRILSTSPGDSYALLDGTSQAAALVSGVAALLRVQQPAWTPGQIRQQLRWTAADISEKNPGLELEIGTGLVDPLAALTQAPPGLEPSQLRIGPADGAGLPSRGEVVGLFYRLENHLMASGPIRVEMISRHPSLLPLRSSMSIGSVLPGQSLTVQPGMLLWTDDNAPTAELGDITLRITAGGRQVHKGFTVEPIPAHVVLSSQGISFTHTNNGRLAYLQPLRSRDPGGVGIGRPGALTQVQLGSLLVGLDGQRVAEAITAPSDAAIFSEFRPPFSGGLSLTADGASSIYTDALAEPRVGVRVDQRTLTFPDPRRGNSAIVVYDLTPTLDDWTGARAGLLIDFEMRSVGLPEANRVRYDAEAALLWAEDLTESRDLIGVTVLETPGALGWNWLRDLRTDVQDGRPYLFDGGNLSYTPADVTLWYLMSHSESSQQSETAGVAAILHCGPFDRTRGEPARLAFAWLLAPDLAGLKTAAAEARNSWAFFREGVSMAVPSQLALMPNVPNPFNPRTEIRFSMDTEQNAHVTILDARGRLVRNLLNRRLLSGYHRVTWDGRDDQGGPVASGVYRVLLQGANASDQQSVVLVR